MQDSREESAPVATNSQEQESGGEADKASACFTEVVETPEKEVAQTPAQEVAQTPAQTPPAQTPQEKECAGSQTPTENVLDLQVFTKNLNITGMGRRRSRLRFTKPPLSKWHEVCASKGIQIFKGFDNLPPAKGLHVEDNDDGNQPVKVVTAGNFVAMNTFFSIFINLATHICRYSVGLPNLRRYEDNVHVGGVPNSKLRHFHPGGGRGLHPACLLQEGQN